VSAEAVRRVDWRFVVGRPRLGRVEVIEPVDAELAEALRLTTTGDGPGGVIAGDTRSTELREAASRATPGRWVWAEVRGRRPLRRRMDDLRAAGLADVSRWWTWPSAAAPTTLVPLDEPPAVELALTRALGGGPVRSVLWRGVAVAGLARLAAREISLLAGRPGDAPRGLAAWLEASRAELGLDPADGPLSCLFLTPRFRASASVVVLVTAGRSAVPRLVVKLPRAAEGATASLAPEAAGLEAAGAHGLGEDGSAPRLVFRGEPEALGGWPVLVETAVPGRPLDAAAVRRRPGRAVAAVEGWLRDLATGAPRTSAAERLERLVAKPLEPVAALGPDERSLVDRTLELCGPLAGAELPVVLEHGDLSHPNVLLAGRRIGAVDWELAEPQGLPLHDLTFFLAYVAGARRKARTPEDHEAAVRRAEGDTGVRLRRHAAALDVLPELVAPLVVASWARQAAGLWRRTEHREPAWLRQSRVVRLWRRALAVASANGEVAACASST